MLTNILTKASRTLLNQSAAEALKYQYSQSQLKDTNPKLFEVLEKQQKTPYLQKAYLAGRIIQIIKKPPQPIIEKSLKDQILDFVDQDEFASNSSKTQVSKMFTEGIILPDEIYRQVRVDEAQTIDSEKVIFHPTFLVTGRAFDVLQNKRKVYLFTGHYGISKTISTIFYQKLSDFVIDYKFRMKNPFQQIEIFENVNKLLYWSIIMETDNQQVFKELLDLQFLDIQKQYFYGLDGRQKVWPLKKKYLKKNVRVLLVVDQLHSLISEVRSKNYRCNEENIANPKFQRIIEIDNIIKKNHHQMKKIVYLSSNNSQLYLKDQLSLVPQKKQSTNISMDRVTLHQKLKDKQNRIQLIDFFLNCLNQFVLSNVKKLVEQSGKNIYQLNIKSFFNEMRVLILSQFDSEPFYINQHTIRLFLMNLDYTKKQRIQKKMCTSFQSLKNQTIKLFKQAQSEMIYQLNQKIAQFLTNDSSHKITKSLFIIQLYDKFMENKQLDFSDETLFTMDHSKLKFTNIHSLEILQNILDRHIFEIDENKNINCIVPPRIFFKLQFTSQAETYLSYAAKQLLEIQSHTLIKYLPKGSSIGLTLQKICKILLTKGSTQIRIFDNKGKQVKIFQKIFHGASTFQGIPRVLSSSSMRPQNIKKQYSLLKSLKEGLKDMILKTKNQDQQTNRIFFPIKSEFKKISTLSKLGYELYEEKIDSTSKDIDLILINYEKNKKKFNIYCLDITIYQDTEFIQKKMQKFLRSYNLFLDKQKNKIQIDENLYEVSLNYYVASLKKNDYSTKLALQVAIRQHELKNYFLSVQDSTRMIKIKENEEKLLNSIGFLCLNQNLKIVNQDVRITESRLFQNIVNLVKGKQKE